MESQKFPPVSKKELWLLEQHPNKQFLGSLARTPPCWSFLKYCISSFIGETLTEFWCIPTGRLQVKAEITPTFSHGWRQASKVLPLWSFVSDPWKLHLYLCSAQPLNFFCQVYFIFFPYKLIILILLFLCSNYLCGFCFLTRPWSIFQIAFKSRAQGKKPSWELFVGECNLRQQNSKTRKQLKEGPRQQWVPELVTPMGRTLSVLKHSLELYETC